MPEVILSDYFYGDESEEFVFFKIPRQLITNPKFKHVSTDAKLLYGMLLDRMSLSARNGWYDDTGRVYIYYSVDEICGDMTCGRDKAMKLLAELDTKKGIGLIERIKQGQGKPTKIYVKAVRALLDGGIDLHGASHITGGGFFENVPRILPQGLEAHFYAAALPCPPIFQLIAKRGNISEHDMYNTFNMGLGMVLAVPEDQEQKALDILRAAGEDANTIGVVGKGRHGVVIGANIGTIE